MAAKNDMLNNPKQTYLGYTNSIKSMMDYITYLVWLNPDKYIKYSIDCDADVDLHINTHPIKGFIIDERGKCKVIYQSEFLSNKQLEYLPNNSIYVIFVKLVEEDTGFKIMEEEENNVTLFREITQKMAETYEKKNADYGDSFGKSLDEFGLVASIVRMSDKFNRIKQLVNNEQQVKDESIKDTLLDLACYSVMSLVWLKQKKK